MKNVTATPCPHCAAGSAKIKMKRQHVHYVDRRVIVCTNVLKPASA